MSRLDEQTDGLVPDAREHDEHLRELDRKILRGSTWVALSWGGRQLLTLASMLVLVRLVAPEAFGLIALASPFLLVLQYVQESGMSAALVQRRGRIEEAAATVLVFSPVMGVTLYAASFVAAPYVADAFDAPRLTSVLRVLGLLLVVRGFSVVPSALLERAMNFRARARIELAAAVVQVGVAIGLAVGGAGVWALVLGQVCGDVTSVLLVWAVSPLRPDPRRASWRLLRELGRYGRFVSGANVLNLFNSTVDNFVVGHQLGTRQLGFYAVAFRLAGTPNSVIGYIVGRVMFSVYSAVQEDIPTVRRVYLQNLQRVALFALPVAVGLIVAADPIVLTLLGERWAAVVTPLRLLAVYGLIRAFAAPTGEVFKGLGRPHLSLLFEFLYSLPLVAGLLLLVPRIGVNGAPLALLIAQCFAALPAVATGMRLLRVRPRELVGALASPVAAAGVLALVLLATLSVTNRFSTALSFALLVVVGCFGYVLGVVLLARDVVVPMWANLRTKRA